MHIRCILQTKVQAQKTAQFRSLTTYRDKIRISCREGNKKSVYDISCTLFIHSNVPCMLVLMSILACAHNLNHKWLCETICALEKKRAWVMLLYVPVFLKSRSDCWVGLVTTAECLSLHKSSLLRALLIGGFWRRVRLPAGGWGSWKLNQPLTVGSLSQEEWDKSVFCDSPFFHQDLRV